MLREAFRDFTFPCAHNYFTRGGTDWFENYKIRCRTTSDVKNRLSLLLVEAKRKKKTSIQHKALPNAEVNVLPQDNNVNVVTVVVVVCLFIA